MDNVMERLAGGLLGCLVGTGIILWGLSGPPQGRPRHENVTSMTRPDVPRPAKPAMKSHVELEARRPGA
jgi:hypothetical protein